MNYKTVKLKFHHKVCYLFFSVTAQLQSDVVLISSSLVTNHVLEDHCTFHYVISSENKEFLAGLTLLISLRLFRLKSFWNPEFPFGLTYRYLPFLYTQHTS